MKSALFIIAQRLKTLSFKSIIEGIVVALIVSLIGYGAKQFNNDGDSEINTTETDNIDKIDVVEDQKWAI